MAESPIQDEIWVDGTRLLTMPFVYRWIFALRHLLEDLLAAGVFGTLVVLWEIAFNESKPTRDQVLGSTGWVSWWANHAMITVAPAVVAAAVFFIGLRVGVGLFLIETPSPTMLMLVVQAALAVVVFIAALISMAHLPGSILALYVPLVAAVYGAVRVRRRSRQGRGGALRRPTSAGFQPSRRAKYFFRGRVWLSSVNKAYPKDIGATTNIADTVMYEAAPYFLRRKDPRSAAYCYARGVDYLLGHAELVEAAKILRVLDEDPRLASQPASRVARALVYQAVGRRVEAHRELVDATRVARRVPNELRVLVLESAVGLGSRTEALDIELAGTAPWSVRTRLAAIWRRQVNAVALSLLLEARTLAESDPDKAIRLAYEIDRLPERLMVELREDDVDLYLYAVRGFTYELVAGIAFRRGDYREANIAYLHAYETLQASLVLAERYTDRAGRCIVRGFIAAVYAGYNTPARENHALDIIRAGMHVLEAKRGALREEEDRAYYIAEQTEIIDEAFTLLADGIRYQHAKAGEFGVWLLESLHRSLTADLLSAGIPADPDVEAEIAELRAEEARVILSEKAEAGLTDEARARLGELTRSIDELAAKQRRGAAGDPATIDMEQLLDRLDGRAGLIYQCTRGSDGRWRINAALITPTGEMRIHNVVLPKSGSDPELAQWLEPGGVLDILADDPSYAPEVYSTPLSHGVWHALSRALLPEKWWDVLCVDAEKACEIVIVPDGPLANLPISVLPVRDGRLLLDYAVVNLAPSFGMLRARDERDASTTAPGSKAPLTVVTHMDDAALQGASAELAQWRAYSSDVVDLIEAQSRAQLEAYLTEGRNVDIVSISVHGAAAEFGRFVRLRDQSMLSTHVALGFTWPRTVLLGACWIGGVDLTVGREPEGFPIACIRKGADCVVGGIASIPDALSGDLLAELSRRLPTVPVPQALREAQLKLSRAGARDDLPPSRFAGLTCWSVAPASTPAPVTSASARAEHPVHWDSDGLPVSEATITAVFDVSPLSQALQRVLAYAQQRAPQEPVGTLGLVRAAIDADDERWQSWLLAGELTMPEPPGTIDETASGIMKVRAAGHDVRITVPLANALLFAIFLRDTLEDENVLPMHAVCAALLEKGSNAQAWIANQRSPEAKHWERHLSDHVFRTDLPAELPTLMDGGGTPTRHEKHIAEGKQRELQAQHYLDRRAWDNKVTALALVLLVAAAPLNVTLMQRLQTKLDGRVAFGVTWLDNGHAGGALAEKVVFKSPAFHAGVRAGDVLHAVNGKTIENGTDAADGIGGYTKGATVNLTLERSGQTVSVTAHMETPPANPTPGSLGVTVENGTDGAYVVAVRPGSAGAAAGIRAGDEILQIYGTVTRGQASVVTFLVHDHDPGSRADIVVERNGKEVSLVAVLGRLS